MIRVEDIIIAYFNSSINQLSSSIDIVNNQLRNENIEFVLDVNKQDGKLEWRYCTSNFRGFINTNNRLITFRFTSFEKANSNINFVKGNLTKSTIYIVEKLDAKIIEMELSTNAPKVLVKIVGEINPTDLGLVSQSSVENNGLLIGSNSNITANLEFITNN